MQCCHFLVKVRGFGPLFLNQKIQPEKQAYPLPRVMVMMLPHPIASGRLTDDQG